MSAQMVIAVIRFSTRFRMEKMVLMMIAEQANWPNGQAQISEAKLSTLIGVEERQLRRYLRRLEQSGELLTTRIPARPTIFEIPQLPNEPDRLEQDREDEKRLKRAYDNHLAKKAEQARETQRKREEAEREKNRDAKRERDIVELKARLKKKA